MQKACVTVRVVNALTVSWGVWHHGDAGVKGWFCSVGRGRQVWYFELYRVNCPVAFHITFAFSPCRSHLSLFCAVFLSFKLLCLYSCFWIVCAKPACLNTLFLLNDLMSLTSNLQHEATEEIRYVAYRFLFLVFFFFFVCLHFNYSGSAELIKVASSFQYVV